MRQLLQNVSSGAITVEDVPPPTPDGNSLLVATRFSLISAGTERAVMSLGNKSLVGKARSRPDLVAKVVENARQEGVSTTYAKVRGRLNRPNELGYSSSGVVLRACGGAPAAPGELVACAGAGRASHAEIVSVPKNLCTRVPDQVAPGDAAYATVASIALHGVRLAEVGLGDVVVVLGLGLVGHLALQLAGAAGCLTLGLDPMSDRVALARSAGFFATTDQAELESEVLRLTARRGADGVLVTAASGTSEPLATATTVARDRAVVCIVGDVPISSPRAPLFSKELRLVVSRSYGPGRYDDLYEERGIDYPASYVRWTEGRNLAEVLRLMAIGKLIPSRLTTHIFDLDDGPRAYALLKSSEPSLGILLRYPADPSDGPAVLVQPRRSRRRRTAHARTRVGVIGAGAFARSTLLPNLLHGADIVAVANATGPSAQSTAARFGAALATTDVDQVLGDDRIDAVLIATRHDTHAEYVKRALDAGKHVFVEKPLALTETELIEVEEAAARSEGLLMVGFNRRYAPMALELKDLLGGRGPLMMSYRVSAGRLPTSHWTHDPKIGGGRIVGEVCHFVDFASFLAGAPPAEVTATSVSGSSEPREDNVSSIIRMADGSVSTIVYASLGESSLPKERIEVLGEAGAGVIDDFRELTVHRGGSVRRRSHKRDKGHVAEMAAFLRACQRGQEPRPVSDLAAVMRATFAVRDRIQEPLSGDQLA